MPKIRLDQLVVDRGLAPSRERARALVLAGQVIVGCVTTTNAGTPGDSAADVALVTPDHPYVGRGGLKLAHALDVGHGQLDWTIRNDPRVVVIEHFNARHLTLADLPTRMHVIVIDVSFISLRHIFPVLPPLLHPGGDVIALVKPQFEAGRDEVRKGIIRDEAVHARVLSEVTATAAAVGLARHGTDTSPITGQKGNVEFLLHLRLSVPASATP